MLASAFVARHRRVHSRGSDAVAAAAGRTATERREERRLLATAPAPPYSRMHGRRRTTQQDGPRHGSARRPRQAAGTELALRRRTAPEAGAEQASVAAAVEDAPGPAAVSGRGEAAELEEAATAAPPSSDLCAVCLEELRGDAAAEALPCSHAYHPACVRPWLAAHRACPCCRAAVPHVVAARSEGSESLTHSRSC